MNIPKIPMCLMDEDKEAEECNKRLRQSLKLFAKNVLRGDKGKGVYNGLW